MPSKDKYPIQFKMGRALYKRLDQAVAASGMSRNKWVTAAILWFLGQERPKRVPVSAYAMLANKRVMTVRLDLNTIDLVDARCEKLDLPRTIWLLDACLGYLAMSERHR